MTDLPEMKRKLTAQIFDNRDYNPTWTCVHRNLCREAQTCAGKPCRTLADWIAAKGKDNTNG